MINKDKLCCPRCTSTDLFEVAAIDPRDGSLFVCDECDFEYEVDT